MVGRPQSVQYRTIIRAFKAAEAAGVRNPTVRIEGRDGTVLTISGKVEEKAPGSCGTGLDGQVDAPA